jgi:hypothetical protein
MLYIVTYATHSERYLPVLKESCPDLVVLGMGDKWYGWKQRIDAYVNFCKQHPKDIICIVDGFDTVVLSSKEEILRKYESFESPLVISKDVNNKNIFKKYLKDKIFGKCKDKRLNVGLMIGISSAIIDFWKDFQGGDDQFYATQQCKKKNITIDTHNKLLYNYSSLDTVFIKDNRIVVNHQYPCIVGAPGLNNINHILKKLQYKNLPNELDINYSFFIKTHFTLFIPEILFVIVTVLLFYTFSFPYSLGLTTIYLCTFLEYELNLKHYDISFFYKCIYLLNECIHLFITFIIFYLFFNLECNIKKLLILNILYFICIFLFFIFKRCILSILSEKIIDNHYIFTGIPHKLSYFMNYDFDYVKKEKNTTIDWMNSNIKVCFIIILLNLYCLYKIYLNPSRNKK